MLIPFTEIIPCAVPDRQDGQTPDRVRLTGWIGGRIAANTANRLAKIDPARLLEGYRQRPGRQTWDGEHVGKWLHAATLAWVNSGNADLRARLDETAAGLAGCQLADGYLGTYLEKDRWTEWDVWAHKYNLLGLLAYVRFTGNVAPPAPCRRMADMLCRHLGDGPGQRDIITAGSQHVGLASTSVLESMALLHRFTGEPRYLEFCHYIVRAWEQPNGPRLVSRLLQGQGVKKVGNAKAYEMLSCLNGALELYRTTGDRRLLQAALAAWEDIAANHLYLTGGASIHEYFRLEHQLPNIDNICETCVTVTWLQFNAQLLRLLGEARFAEQLERVVLNQLLGAQRPDGGAWGYYVQMEGRKPYSASLDGHCCLSSGPRGIALIPTFAVTTDADGIVVNLYDNGSARLALRDGTEVVLTIDTRYPADGRVHLTLDLFGSRRFAVRLRIPAWCSGAGVRINGEDVTVAPGPDGYTVMQREWRHGDSIDLQLPLAARVLSGDNLNQGKAALLHGPLVLAADEALLEGSGQRVTTISLPSADPLALHITPAPAPVVLKTWPDAQIFRLKAVAHRSTPLMAAGKLIEVPLLPFAEAGAGGSRYRVWLPVAAKPPAHPNLLLAGEAGCSASGVDASAINNDDLTGSVRLYCLPGTREAWFGVTLDAPVRLCRVVYIQGEVDSEGGWFDNSAGKPRVQIQRPADVEWVTVGELNGYPATTSAEDAGLRSGQAFELDLPAPVDAIAVRVVGTPAGGGNAGHGTVTCAELQAFA